MSDAASATARRIPRRPPVTWAIGLALALGLAAVLTPALTAERWLGLGPGAITAGAPAPWTVRVPPFAGAHTADGDVGGGGVIVARGAIATAEQAQAAQAVLAARPLGGLPVIALFALAAVLGGLFTHHMRRSPRGRLVRVQLVSLGAVAAVAIAVKALMLTTTVSILAVPVALLAIVPTLVLDRIVGIATGVLAALFTALLVPFDVTVAILLLVQAAAAGIVVPEAPRRRWRAALIAGALTTLLTAATLALITSITMGALPAASSPLRSPWLAAAIGPAIAAVLAVPLVPLYQVLVGEITQAKLVELEDLSHKLLRQIADRAPGTWQHSLTMANFAEMAANAIGANGRLVRVGAYFHDLGKSLRPKYFIENLVPGEPSPHDQLAPEDSATAIFAHVTEGIAEARRAGLHERIVDFMHMHHGDGVLEYFWGRATEGGNPRGLSIDRFRYPGHPPQTRETAILAICDAVEAASRTLRKPEPAAIDALVQRIVYGKLHLGQLDESGLSMGDLRRVVDSLREAIRAANHARIEYPWQREERDASATGAEVVARVTGTAPRLDSLDQQPRREATLRGPRAAAASSRADAPTRDRHAHRASTDALADTADQGAARAAAALGIEATAPLGPAALSEAGSSDDGAAQAPARAAAPGVEPARAAAPGVEPARASDSPPGSPARAAAPAHPPQTLPGSAPPAAPRPLAPRGAPVHRPDTEPPEIGWLAAAERAERAPRRPGAPQRARPPQPPPAPVTPPAGLAPLPPGAEPGEDPAAIEAPAAAGIAAGRTLPGHVGPSAPGDAAVARAGADAAITEPALPRFPAPGAPWAAGLADRIDAALPDEWGQETPVIPPSGAALRALLGAPDPTRQQSVEELEALHRAVEELPSEPGLEPARRARPTAEVDPDQIEAAIEVAPPARRAQTAATIARPKKPGP